MIENRAVRWQARSARPHAMRHNAEREIQRMPLWAQTARGARVGDWVAGLVVVAVFVVLFVVLP